MGEPEHSCLNRRSNSAGNSNQGFVGYAALPETVSSSPFSRSSLVLTRTNVLSALCTAVIWAYLILRGPASVDGGPPGGLGAASGGGTQGA